MQNTVEQRQCGFVIPGMGTDKKASVHIDCAAAPVRVPDNVAGGNIRYTSVVPYEKEACETSGIEAGCDSSVLGYSGVKP